MLRGIDASGGMVFERRSTPAVAFAGKHWEEVLPERVSHALLSQRDPRALSLR